MLRDYFRAYAFEGVADHLGIAAGATVAREPGLIPRRADTRLAVGPCPRPLIVEVAPVTVVVPCFNEAQALPYLANTLTLMEQELAGSLRAPIHFCR